MFNRLLPKNRVLRFLIITFWPRAIMGVGGQFVLAPTPWLSLNEAFSRLTDMRIWALMAPVYPRLGLLLAIGDFNLNRQQRTEDEDGKE